MFLAGLYDSVTLEGSTESLWTFTIVTTDANKQLSWLHDRQPVILSTKAELDAWLNTSTGIWFPELSKVVQCYRDAKAPLECYRVPQDVGKVGTESSTYIEPITQRKDGILAMFAKRKTHDSGASSKQHGFAEPSTSKSPIKRTLGSIDISDDGEHESQELRKKQKTVTDTVDNKTEGNDNGNGNGTLEQITPSSSTPSKSKPIRNTSNKPTTKSPSKPAPKDNKSITQFFAKN